MTIKELSKRLVEYKDQGNNQFKQKQYPVAASIFTGGVDLFLANEAQCRTDSDCMVKVAQLYTNRALAYANNNEQEPAFKDADYVLTNIDHRNAKALFRRAQYFRLKNQLVKAEQDLTLLCKVDTKNAAARKDLAEVKKMIKKENESKSKIKEVAETTAEGAAPIIEEVEQVEPQKPKTVLKTKNVDQDTVDKAAERAAQDAI